MSRPRRGGTGPQRGTCVVVCRVDVCACGNASEVVERYLACPRQRGVVAHLHLWQGLRRRDVVWPRPDKEARPERSCTGCVGAQWSEKEFAGIVAMIEKTWPSKQQKETWQEHGRFQCKVQWLASSEKRVWPKWMTKPLRRVWLERTCSNGVV